jgi:hypothetical protein
VRNPERLGELPDDVCRLLRIDTASRMVMIDRDTITHIFDPRSFDDAAIIVGTLARRTFDPVYCGRDLADARLSFIMELPFPGAGDVVGIALKLVNALTSASRHHEIWIATAHLVGDSTLNRMLRSNRFAVHRRN